MIRKIVDYQKLNEDILKLLVDKFPDGYSDRDIIAFRNAQNEYIETVEVRTEDTVYLVKVGKRLVQAMEDFEEDEDEDNSLNNEVESDNESIDTINGEDLD